MEYKHSEETRAKWREDYVKNRDKLLPVKLERRKKRYAENRDIELERAHNYYHENKEEMKVKSLIRYYKKLDDTAKVMELETKLTEILEQKMGGE